jgi:hypothetical protein
MFTLIQKIYEGNFYFLTQPDEYDEQPIDRELCLSKVSNELSYTLTFVVFVLPLVIVLLSAVKFFHLPFRFGSLGSFVLLGCLVYVVVELRNWIMQHIDFSFTEKYVPSTRRYECERYYVGFALITLFLLGGSVALVWFRVIY